MIVGSIFFIILVAACQTQKGANPFAGPISNPDSSTQLFNKSTTVCDPMGGTVSDGNGPRSGLQGKLFYLTDNMPRFTTVEDYTNAIDTRTTVFLNDLNVPTRMFTEGFPTADGSLLQVGGQTLVEWFALYLETQLQLTPDDAPGAYQLAMIADDGGTLELVGSGGTFQRFLDDDGTHSSRLACAASPLLMSQSVGVPARVKYYQGPRTEIALMLLWRPTSLTGVSSEPLCGAVGQNLFFEYHNNPSTPQQAYLDLLSRGWKPLKPGNFGIPGQARINPCNTNGENWAF